MRYTDLIRKGDHLEIKRPNQDDLTIHRVDREPTTSRPTQRNLEVSSEVKETLTYSGITGEPVEVPSSNDTPEVKSWRRRRAERIKPKASVSYGINDIDRAGS